MVKELRGSAMSARPVRLLADDGDKVLAFLRGDLLFIFNFHHSNSYTDYGIIVPPATSWKHLFDTDEKRFGGQGLVQQGGTYLPSLVLDGRRHGELVQQIKAYLPARTAIVLKKIKRRKNG